MCFCSGALHRSDTCPPALWSSVFHRCLAKCPLHGGPRLLPVDNNFIFLVHEMFTKMKDITTAASHLVYLQMEMMQV